MDLHHRRIGYDRVCDHRVMGPSGLPTDGDDVDGGRTRFHHSWATGRPTVQRRERRAFPVERHMADLQRS